MLLTKFWTELLGSSADKWFVVNVIARGLAASCVMFAPGMERLTGRYALLSR